MRPSSEPSADRRHDVGLTFDPATGQLALGTFSSTLAPGASNREVLNAYVELAARSRGDRVANLVDIRQDDVDALALALDLEAEDLAAEIQQVLGATRSAALSMAARLRSSRVIGGITKAATGVVVAGSLAVGATALAGAGSGVAPTPAPAAVAAPASAPAADTSAAPAGDEVVVDGPLTVDDQGVGLIPPVTEESSGAVLIPPANEDAPGTGLIPPANEGE